MLNCDRSQMDSAMWPCILDRTLLYACFSIQHVVENGCCRLLYIRVVYTRSHCWSLTAGVPQCDCAAAAPSAATPMAMVMAMPIYTYADAASNKRW